MPKETISQDLTEKIQRYITRHIPKSKWYSQSWDYHFLTEQSLIFIKHWLLLSLFVNKHQNKSIEEKYTLTQKNIYLAQQLHKPFSSKIPDKGTSIWENLKQEHSTQPKIITYQEFYPLLNKITNQLHLSVSLTKNGIKLLRNMYHSFIHQLINRICQVLMQKKTVSLVKHRHQLLTYSHQYIPLMFQKFHD